MASLESQLASTVLMIRPVSFVSNPMTAASNRFQNPTDESPEQQQSAALQEFDALVAALRVAGVSVIVEHDTEEPHTPDAIFPNNWVSFHADGTVVPEDLDGEGPVPHQLHRAEVAQRVEEDEKGAEETEMWIRLKRPSACEMILVLMVL